MIFEKLQGIIADKLSVEPSEITLTSNFKEDLGADSLDLFEIVMGIEEAFDISIDNDDLEKIQTVQDAVKYVEARQ